ncbi:TetR/AcrR family transcriptional regulator [Stappia sp. BW2]|uniref:TetR/AcrR family transcriptional regulator n=1 Tax=Stappia sp. BW2 TaxID=2592622 RepID=UPI0011DEBBE4|nr:TetR/AcrR family transcriptional regulator [Stappia sp. BW2]TYC79863.1 TetR/AcrR family transcriptional regulator [Stappia sp. BW2]
MVQVLKEELREAILKSAGEVFAEQGFKDARLSDIAARAGTSTSNLYKYAKDKAALFDQVVPKALAERYAGILERRVSEFSGRPDWQALTHTGSRDAADLLHFWIAHRHVAVILMSRGGGTAYEAFGARMVSMMVESTLANSGAADNGPHVRMLLEQIFTNTLTTLSSILMRFEEEADITAAVSMFWRFQLAGLTALHEDATKSKQPR